MQPNGQGNAISIYVENSGNLNWRLGEEHTENYSMNLPKSVPKGEYSLKAKLVYNSPEGARDVHVGISKDRLDQENYFLIGNVQVK